MNRISPAVVTTVLAFLVIGTIAVIGFRLEAPAKTVSTDSSTEQVDPDNGTEPRNPEVSTIVIRQEEIPQESRPQKVPEDAIVAFYPVGKRVRSIADLSAQGTGSNEHWSIKRDARFIYQYRFAVETEVVGRQEDSVTFRQHFAEVSQVRVVSDETLEFVPPDSPLAHIAWGAVRSSSLAHPQLRLVISSIELLHTVDPQFKNTLTNFSQQLRSLGVPLESLEGVEFEVDIDRLTGMEMEFDYVSGLGVTAVRVLRGAKFDEAMLRLLASNSSLFLDYFIGNVEQTPVGEPLEVRSQDVSGLMPFGYDIQIDGRLIFRREPDGNAGPGEAPGKSLSPVGGEVSVATTSDGLRKSGRLKPISGTIQFSPEDRLVRRARIQWDVGMNWMSEERRYLLFRTEGIRNLKLETRYNAERMDPVVPP